jgi:hypothetical protein
MLGQLMSGKDIMKDIIFVLRSVFMIQAEQSRNLANSLKNDVMGGLEKVIKDH